MGGCCSRNDIREGLRCRDDDDEDEEEEEERFFEADDGNGDGGANVVLKGSSKFATLFSQQGWKGVNQDSLTVWENFMGDTDKIFCGVFDGHGPVGHKVSAYIREALPRKLQSLLLPPPILKCDDNETNEKERNTQSNHCDDDETNKEEKKNQSNHCDDNDSAVNEDEWISSWSPKVVKAFEEVDRDLGNRANIDSICSGSTTVAIVREKEHLVVANLGDSRAILCTRDGKNQQVAVQLTVDLKPNLPSEAERIRNCQGRVFALDEEPDVCRVWLPDEDCPGLAMARSFGDFCLKDYGLISTPQITYRKLSENDEFIVLATDGIWDVLSNAEVVKIVSSAKKQSDAAKQVVHRAVRAWRYKHPTSLIDDCSVVCLFLKTPVASNKPSFPSRSYNSVSSEFSHSDSFKSAVSGGDSSESEAEPTVNSKDEHNNTNSLSRVNSSVKHPRMTSALNLRKKTFKIPEVES